MAGNTVDIKFNSNLEDIAKGLDLLKQKIDSLASTQILDKSTSDATKSDIKEINESFSKLSSYFTRVNLGIKDTQFQLDLASSKASSFRAALESAKTNGSSDRQITSLTKQLLGAEEDVNKWSANLKVLNAELDNIKNTMDSLSLATAAAMNPDAAKEFAAAIKAQSEAELERSKLIIAENQRAEASKLARRNAEKQSIEAETAQIAELQTRYRNLITEIESSKGTLSAEDISNRIKEVRDQLSNWGKQPGLMGMANLQSELTSVFDKLTKLSDSYAKEAAKNIEDPFQQAITKAKAAIAEYKFKIAGNEGISDYSRGLYDNLFKNFADAVQDIDFDKLTDKQLLSYRAISQERKALAIKYYEWEEAEEKRIDKEAADFEIEQATRAEEEKKRLTNEQAELEQRNEQERKQRLEESVNAFKNYFSQQEASERQLAEENRRIAEEDRRIEAEEAANRKRRVQESARVFEEYFAQQEEAAKRQEEEAKRRAAEEAEAIKQQEEAAKRQAEAEAALHKKRAENIKLAVETVKEMYRSVTTVTQESIDAFRNGIKTIKSDASQLAGILGVEEYASSTSQILKGALTNASALVESQNLLNQMFEKDISLTIEWADKQSYAYGLASNAARIYLSQIGGMLQNTGIENEELVETMTLSYTKLAGDLASAFNTTTDTAFYAIRSGIAGMSRPLEKFGINLKMNTLQQWMDAKGIEASYIKLSEYNKQMVRYAYIMEQTQKIHGDYSETFSSFANMTKSLKNEWQNFLDLVGKYAVPVFKPVVMWLLTAIEYAKEFINIFAELMGLEPYDFEHAGVQYYNDTEKALENEEEQQNDITKAVEKTNKARKKGIKLLDLYELDFGDDTKIPDVGDTGDEIEEAKLNFEGLIEDYGNFKPDFDIKVDKKAVKDFAKQVKNVYDWLVKTFDSIWHFKLGPISLEDVFNDALDKLAHRPGEFAFDIFSILFSSRSLSRSTGLFRNYISKVLSSGNIKEALRNPSLLDRAQGFGIALAGAIAAGFGGYNLGQAIYDGNAFDTLTGVFDTLSGVALGAMGGLMIGGPVGAAVGAGVALAAALIAGYNGYLDEHINELGENMSDAMDAALNVGGMSFSEKYKLIDNLYDAASDSENYTVLMDRIGNISSTIEPIINETLPSLYEKYREDPGNAGIEKAITDAKKTMVDAIDSMQNSLNDFSISTITSTLSLLRDQLGLTDQQITGISSHLTQLYADIDKQAATNYTYLKSKEAEGATLTADEKALLAVYEEKLNLLGKQKEAYKEYFDNIKADATSTQDAINKINKGVDTWRTNLSGAIQEAETERSLATANLEKLKATPDATEEDLKKAQKAIDDATKAVDLAKTALYNFDVYTNDLKQKVQQEASIATLTALGQGMLTASQYELGADRVGELVSNWDTNCLKKVGAALRQTAPSSIVPIEQINPEILAQLQKLGNFSGSEIEDIYNGFLGGVLASFGVDAEGNLDFGEITATLGIGELRIPPIRQGAYKDKVYDVIKESIQGTGYSVTRDGDTVKLKSAPMTLSTPIKPIGYMSPSDIALYAQSLTDNTKDSVEDASKTTADNYSSGVESELESDANIEKVAAGTSAALAGATNTDEATEKGKELGSAYISGLASAIAAGNQAGSPYKTALEGMVNAFKDALKDIGGAINIFAHTLSSEVNNLGISDDVTFSSLLSIIKTKGASFNAIPKLASGAVIPPNNPFLAVLGDQRNGYNVEAPVSVIQEAVREANAEQETTVDVRVYLGNTEFRDYIVDTVIDSNLVTG